MDTALKYSGYAAVGLLAFLATAPKPVAAFGAGNISSVSKLEGNNFRHGDIEDTLAVLRDENGKKLFSREDIKLIYFGNWLRDYSQALDVATIGKVDAESIRVLVWILSFLSVGYATDMYEVTAERLGVYRPEEHIDNPKGYADAVDPKTIDKRLRPVEIQNELSIDPDTGMKNYIANEAGRWGVSAGYIRNSLYLSIREGRRHLDHTIQMTHEERKNAKYDSLRHLGQALHTLEDFSAHSNYVELVLQSVLNRSVFAHVSDNESIRVTNPVGRKFDPLVTGTFGGVDFFHSILGEASDNVAQTEVNTVETGTSKDTTINSLNAKIKKSQETDEQGRNKAQMDLRFFIDALDKVKGLTDFSRDGSGAGPDQGNLRNDFATLKSDIAAMEGFSKASQTHDNDQFQYNQAGQKTEVQSTIDRIYPILKLRDKIVRTVSSIVQALFKVIPGLEKTLTQLRDSINLFVMSLLAPYIVPVIKVATKHLQTGSSTVLAASEKEQFKPWTEPDCTDPTHSMLSKDHFSNILNKPAGMVAIEVIAYAATRIEFAWRHPGVSDKDVVDDILQALHHPAWRDDSKQLQGRMYNAVKKWKNESELGEGNITNMLTAEAVKAGKNNIGGDNPHGHGHSGTQHHQKPSHPDGFGQFDQLGGGAWGLNPNY